MDTTLVWVASMHERVCGRPFAHKNNSSQDISITANKCLTLSVCIDRRGSVGLSLDMVHLIPVCALESHPHRPFTGYPGYLYCIIIILFMEASGRDQATRTSSLPPLACESDL